MRNKIRTALTVFYGDTVADSLRSGKRVPVSFWWPQAAAG